MNNELTNDNLDDFEDYVRNINPNISPDKANLFVSVITDSEGAKDFYKGEGGSRKKDAEQFPFPDIRKESHFGGALISEGGYRTMVKNMIKRHGGNPDLWEPEKPSGMKHKTNSILESDDGETTYLRIYLKVNKNTRAKSIYKLSDGTEIDKKDDRVQKWVKPAKKSWTPKWVDNLGFNDEQKEAFLEEFNTLVVMSPKRQNIKKLKAGDFNFSR